MSTVLDSIKRSLRLLGVKASGENLSSEEANDAFEALNAMIDGFNNQSLMIHNLETVTATLSAGTGSYTIGPGGTIDTVRPQRIENAYCFEYLSDNDWPMEIINNEQYSRIWDKAIETTYPCFLYYESSYPLGTIKVYPVPSAATVLNMQVWNQLTAFASTASTIALPPGYEDLIVYNLAVRIAPEYGVEPSPTVQSIARDSITRVKILNNKNSPVVRSPMRNIGSRDGGFNDIRGYFNT